MKRHHRLQALIHLLVVLSIVWISPGTAAPQRAEAQGGSGPISYAYDPLGRLVAVTDPGQTDGTARYSYDAVGNLTAITRQSATLLSIFEFAPRKAPTGNTVTIYGSGFSSTPSQNTVRFNGVQATVTTASSSQLAVVIPPNVTPGTLSVAVGGGSPVNSSATFTAGSSVPSISGISTPMAGPLTAVPITGANFDPVIPDPTSGPSRPINNTVILGDLHAVVSANAGTSGGTSLNFEVPPGARTGRLTVSNPGGTTVSNTAALSNPYFYVPPAGIDGTKIKVQEWIDSAQGATPAKNATVALNVPSPDTWRGLVPSTARPAKS